jgi:hypothetical protein
LSRVFEFLTKTYIFPSTVEPSSRTALDRSGLELTASLDLVDAEADSMARPLSARAMLAPSAITAVRRRRRANRGPPGIMSILPSEKAVV